MGRSKFRTICYRTTLPLLAVAVLAQGCRSKSAEMTGSATMVKSDQGQLKFNVGGQTSLALASAPATGSEALSGIVISIKNSNGVLVAEDRQLSLLKLSDSYVTAPIDLPVGSYTLEKFQVLEGANIIYASPLKGSSKEKLVKTALPLAMTVEKDKVLTSTPEVVDVFEAVAEDFGYASFKFEIVKAYDVLMSASGFNDTSKVMELTTAHALITGVSKIYFDGDLAAVTNKLTLRDQTDDLTVKVSKAGYVDEIKKLTSDELKQFLHGKALNVFLTKKVVPKNVTVCGAYVQNHIPAYIPDGLTVVFSCSPDDNTQALLLTRNYDRNAINPILIDYVTKGGIVISEWSNSADVYNQLFGTSVNLGTFDGNCTDAISPVTRLTTTDKFWLDNAGLAAPSLPGCGFDMSSYPGLTKLGAWASGNISLGYRALGLGRAWMVETDWADGEVLGNNQEGNALLMKYMITHK